VVAGPASSDVMGMADQVAALPAPLRRDGATSIVGSAPGGTLKILAHMMLTQLADLRIAVRTSSDDAARRIARLPLEQWEAAAKTYADGLVKEQMVNSLVRLVVLEEALKLRSDPDTSVT